MENNIVPAFRDFRMVQKRFLKLRNGEFPKKILPCDEGIQQNAWNGTASMTR